MWKYLGGRLLQNVLTFFFFLTLVFFVIDLQPGDYCNVYLSDPRLTPDQRAFLRARLGCDKPVLERYAVWVGNVFEGDLGISFSNAKPVWDVMVERAPRTVMLFLSATVVSFYVGFLAGKMLAWRRGGALEYGATLGGVVLFTVFTPWFGLMMIWFFAYNLKLFPLGKFLDPVLWRGAPTDANFVFFRLLLTGLFAALALFAWILILRRVDTNQRDRIGWIGYAAIIAGIIGYWATTGVARYALDMVHHLVLPIMTLTLVSFAGTMLLTRNSMLETLREDYILTARAKGLSEQVIRDKHAARNALLPVVTSLVFSLAFTLNGGVITETVFSWPGMGQTLLAAAQSEDIPMAIGALMFIAILALTAHLVADILYAYLDPRIRYA